MGLNTGNNISRFFLAAILTLFFCKAFAQQNCIPSITAQTQGDELSCNAIDFGYILTDYLNNDPNTVYEIDFGDGNTQTLNQNDLEADGETVINHTYNTVSCETEDKAYTFTLTARSECSPEFPRTVSISPIITGRPPVPSFAFDPEDGCVNEPIPFQNTSVDGFNFQCATDATYFWDFGDGTTIETTSKDPINHTYGAIDNYTVTLRVVQDCGEFTFSQEIEVNGPPKPIFEIGDAGNLLRVEDCANNTYIPTNVCVPLEIPIRSISTGGGLTETWTITPAQGATFSNNNTTSGNPNETITFTEAGVYTLNLNAASNCGNENSCVRIVVSNVPDPSQISIEGLEVSTCSPADIDLSVNTQVTNITNYQWQITGINGTANPNLPVGVNTANPDPFTLTPGQYEVALTLTNDCGSATAIEQIEIVDFADPVVLPLVPELCIDETIELSTPVVAGATYQWFFEDEIIDGQTNASFETDELGNYKVEVSLLGCIKTSENVELVLKPTPLAEITPPAQTVFCEGEAVSAILQGNAGANLEYQWLLDGNPIVGATNQDFTATEAGIYTLEVTERGCSAISEADTISSVLDPDLNINTATELEICPQETIEIIASGAEAYFWQPNVGIDTLEGNTVTLSPLTSTTYTLTGINGGRCEDVIQIEVTVRPLPDISLEDELVCIDAPAFQLEVTTGGNGTGSWQALGLPDGSVTPEGIFDPAVAGINENGHDVQFLFTQDNGCDLVFNKKVFVNDLPQASFDAPAAVCNLTTFTPIVTSPDTLNSSYVWEVNGNFFSNAKEPQFAFNNPNGLETITLQITDENGCTNSFTQEIEIQSEIFEPSFTYDTSSPNNCGPLEVTFTNGNLATNVTYTWDFGNGDISTEPTPDPQIFTEGFNGDTTYYINLEAETACGTYSFTDSVFVRAGVSAFFTASTDTISSNFPVTFYNLTEDNANTFTWNFGDGTDEVTTTEIDSIQHNFIYFGQGDSTFTVSLTAENDCGTNTFTREITVIPNVFFNVRPQRGCAPLTVDFATNLTETISTVWLWGDVPGNGIAGGNEQSYTYENAGVYDASLIVAYDFGELDTFTAQITVLPILEANFEVTGSFCPGEPVTFTNTSSDPIGSAWNFGDSTTFNGVNPPAKIYDEPGTYEVSLTVVNPFNNCPGTIIKTVEIKPFVVPDFMPSNDTICVGQAVQLINLTENATSYRWTFDDNKNIFTSLEASPEWIFDTPGEQRITLEAFDEPNLTGCTAEITKTIIVEPGPEIAFEVIKEARCGIWFVSAENLSTFPSSPANGSLVWQFSNGTSYTGFSDIPFEPFVYDSNESNIHEITLIATTKTGCVERLTVPFEIEDCCDPIVYLPEDGRTMAFTPYNGGGNELFRLKHEFVEEYDLRLYDKWDRMVFQTNDPDEGWNGYFAGTACPAGAYKGIVTYGGCKFGEKTEPEARAFLFYLVD